MLLVVQVHSTMAWTEASTRLRFAKKGFYDPESGGMRTHPCRQN
jgi:hypothetical protein